MNKFSIDKRAKTFTLEESNRTLPLVRAIAADLARVSRQVTERRQRLSQLNTGHDRDTTDFYAEELEQIKIELAAETRRIEYFEKELRDLGVESQNAEEGIVDFPCFMDDRLIYLCWQLGEPEILYWREIDAGFAERKRLTAATVPDGSFDS